MMWLSYFFSILSISITCGLEHIYIYSPRKDSSSLGSCLGTSNLIKDHCPCDSHHQHHHWHSNPFIWHHHCSWCSQSLHLTGILISGMYLLISAYPTPSLGGGLWLLVLMWVTSLGWKLTHGNKPQFHHDSFLWHTASASHALAPSGSSFPWGIPLLNGKAFPHWYPSDKHENLPHPSGEGRGKGWASVLCCCYFLNPCHFSNLCRCLNLCHCLGTHVTITKPMSLSNLCFRRAHVVVIESASSGLHHYGAFKHLLSSWCSPSEWLWQGWG